METIIGACCSAGQRKCGVNDGPYVLSENNITFEYIVRHDEFNDLSGYKCLYDIVKENIRKFPMVVGGDHSIAVGSVGAVVDHYNSINKKVFVIWIDAHADINTYDTSISQNTHGMPVAFLMKLCEQNIIKLDTKLLPSQLIYIGLRDVDPPEQLFLDSLGIKYYTMADVIMKGIGSIMSEIKSIINNEDVHVSLDIDGLDPLYCPATGTPVNGGLSLNDTITILDSLHSLIVSCDIVEFNPRENDNVSGGVNDTIICIKTIIDSFKKNKKKV